MLGIIANLRATQLSEAEEIYWSYVANAHAVPRIVKTGADRRIDNIYAWLGKS